jgi:hypothetical protein
MYNVRMNNVRFFDHLESESSAYWLGFFCADGYLYKNGKQARVLLAVRDSAHLQKFASEFGRTIRMSNPSPDKRTGKVYPNCQLLLNSKHLCDCIRSFEIPQQKTRGLDGRVFEYIPQRSISHFVRGYFDGDGCISKIGFAEYRMTIVSTQPFLRTLRDVVCEATGITGGSLTDRSGCSALTWCGTERLQVIKTWMYSRASIYLDRKREMFNAMPLHRGVSRFKYVYWSKQKRKWQAREYSNGRMTTIGHFDSEEEAANARRERGSLI